MKAQSITARGGIVYAEGLDNTANIDTQPRIEVSANDILVTEGSVPLINSIYPVYCETAAVVVRATTFLNERTTDTLYNFTVNDLGALLLDVSYIALVASMAFDVSNLNPSSNVTTLIVDAINIFAAESLLRSDNACRTSIKANQIVCRTTIVGQSAVLTQGAATQPPPLSARIATTVIVADLLLLNAIGTDGSDTGRASMIDHRTGVLDLRVERYGVNGSFYNAIRIGPGMQVNSVKVGLCGIIATESRFLFLNGGPGADQTTCTIDCDLIGCGLGVAGATNIAAIDVLYGQLEGSLASVVFAGDSTCSCVLLRGLSNYTVQTGRLYVNGGSAVALNVQDASSVIADIGIMVTENGSIVRFASSSDRSVVQFQQMRCGDTTEPLQFLGSGDVWMTGLDIRTGTSTNLVHISNNSSVSLAVESVSSEAADTLFLVDTSGFLHFTGQQVTGDNISTAAIHGNGANSIRFSSELLNVESALASADFFRLESTSYCAITCQTLNCLEIAALLRATSTGVSSSAHLQFDSFYCDAVQRLVYAANNAQVFVSFQSLIANALSNDAFTALDNGTRVQINGSSLVCDGKFNSPNIFLIGPGTALLTANIPVIALGGNTTASLIACSGAGTATLDTKKFTGGDMTRLISVQSEDSIVSVSIDSLVVENGTTQALVFVEQATLRITGKQWRFNNPVLQTLFHARVNGTLQVGLNLLETLNPCAHVLHTEQSARVRLEADVIDIDGSASGAFLLTDQESTSIRTERLRVANNTAGFPFISATSGDLTLLATRIDANTVDTLLSLSGVKDSTIDLYECSASLRNTGFSMVDSRCTFRCQYADLPADPLSTPTAVFYVGDGAQVNASFGFLRAGSVGFHTQGGADLRVSLDYMQTANACLLYESTGTVTFLPKQAIALSGPVVYINASSGVSPITLGGFFNVPAAAHAIEYDPLALAPPNLRLFSSSLVSSAEAIYSPTATVSVSAMPSSVSVDVNVNVSVQPAGALLVGTIF